MKKKHILWLYLFLFATLADITFLLERRDNLRLFSKPLIILGLSIYFFQITRPIASSLLTRSILGALIFSWLGDILLMWPSLFMYGLGAFFLAHVCYVIGFKVAQKSPQSLIHHNFIKQFFFNLPFYITAAFVFYLINPNLGIFKIPVILYIIAILSMVTSARERFGKCNTSSFWQVFIGASLFFLSDGVLALNKFHQAFEESGILIMGSYAVGQLLIVMGIRSFLIQPR